MRVQAWVLEHADRAGELGEDGIAGFDLKHIVLDEPGEGEVLVEPLFVSWEGNLGHAIRRRPIDICAERGDDQVILGNSGAVRVLRAGSRDSRFREGDIALVFPRGEMDRYGYTRLVHGYDKPGSQGILAKRAVVPECVLFPISDSLGISPEQLTAGGRYFIAWNNWRVALACWQSQMVDEDPGDHLVFAWGGGVALGGILLARDAGFKVAMATSSDARIEQFRELGIIPVDRREFPGLVGNAEELTTRELRQQRPAAEANLAQHVRDISPRGEGAAIALDNIGGLLYLPTLSLLARQGVISTVGWKAGMRLTHLRASEAIARHIHVYTHVSHERDVQPAIDYAAAGDWIPEVDSRDIYAWEDARLLAHRYDNGGTHSYFPMVQVNAL